MGAQERPRGIVPVRRWDSGCGGGPTWSIYGGNRRRPANRTCDVEVDADTALKRTGTGAGFAADVDHGGNGTGEIPGQPPMPGRNAPGDLKQGAVVYTAEETSE